MSVDASGHNRQAWNACRSDVEDWITAGAIPGAIVQAMTLETGQRWRCAGCGNLTRFDITRTRRTSEFWHFDLAGDHEIEQVDVLQEEVDRVACRWCGRDDAVEVIERGKPMKVNPGS